MNVSASLWVWLKGADLVAGTALLTLREKMGYDDRLLGIQRFDAYGFSMESDAPGEAVDALERMLAFRSTLYNRNKHSFCLECRWGARGRAQAGQPLDVPRRRLIASVMGRPGAPREFDGNDTQERVILKGAPIYRSEILVEDLDASVKAALSKQLAPELAAAEISVQTLGTAWHLLLRVASADDARAVTREIAVSRGRDRGLLLNPNNQGFQMLHVERIRRGE